jgi:hypothetical protein
MHETENNIEVATKALEQAAITAEEIRIEMEERTPKVIRFTYGVFEMDMAKAQKAVLEMGYTKEDIRAFGYDVNA